MDCWGAKTLHAHHEAVSQAAHADALLISKADLASADVLDDLRALLSRTAPHARLLTASTDAAAIQCLLEPFRLGAAAFVDLGPHAGRHDHVHHDHGLVNTTSWRFDERLPWALVAQAFDAVVTRYRGRLMRMKGVLAVSDTDRPVVVDGVQDIFHPPRLLQRWPNDDRSSRVVMISRDASSAEAMDHLRRLLDRAPAPAS